MINRPTVGAQNADGSTVIKINRQTFIVQLSRKWLQVVQLDSLDSTFFLIDNNWHVKLPLTSANIKPFLTTKQ